MAILVINGAPRKSGYTRELTELFCAGARAAGDNPEVVDLTKHDIRPCIGCYGCWKPSSPGRCVQHDDMTELLERVLDSTYLMLATPLYFFNFSAIMKAFLERLFPLVKPDLERSPEMGLLRNVRRFPELRRLRHRVRG
jgi:multimeric flavodoxin WrbA